jgi:hypothetical protein
LQIIKYQQAFSSLHGENGQFPEVDLKGHSIEELAKFANVSADVIVAAIKMRQEQMRQSALSAAVYVTPISTSTNKLPLTVRPTTTTTTTTTTTVSYTPKRKVSSYAIYRGHKVCIFSFS